MTEIEQHLENEWFTVRHSGEMPEVAYHSAIYYLTEDKEGPGLSLDKRHSIILKEAAAERYQEIILRDLDPSNRDKSIYRGVKRSIANYQRYRLFCKRQQLSRENFGQDVAAALLLFLGSELTGVSKGVRESVINCSFEELNEFAVEVGLVADMLPDQLQRLCNCTVFES